MLNVAFLSRAFEKGGDFSMDVFSKKYSPFEHYVGLKSPEQKRYSYFTDEAHKFDLVSVTKEGDPVANRTLEVRVYEVRWRWWWSGAWTYSRRSL